MILKPAIEALASAIVLCHNHPSGNIMPSEADNLLTQKTKNACQLVDIDFIDHLIVSNEKYFSYADIELV